MKTRAFATLSFQHRDENYYAPPLLLSTSESMFFELDRGENSNFFFFKSDRSPWKQGGRGSISRHRISASRKREWFGIGVKPPPMEFH